MDDLLSYMILLKSQTFGAGKTWACLSYRRPGREPQRLIFDGEYRTGSYKSKDTQDYPKYGKFAFSDWNQEFGEDFVKAVLKVIKSLDEGTFSYNMLGIDNGSIFQDEIDAAMHTKSVALQLTDALGITQKHSNFLNFRFNPNDTAAYYFLVKAVIRGFLLKLRQANVDVVVTAESKNVWVNYGSRDKANPAKIIGQTVKLWDPWLQVSDLLLDLDRIEGSRANGTAKLAAYPTASLDTFNPKCSIPGIKPQFVFDNWDTFWAMAKDNEVPSSEQFGKLVIPDVITVEGDLGTLDEAKKAIVAHAIEKGFVTDALDARLKLPELGRKVGLDTEDALSRYEEWVAAINQAVDGD